MDKLELLRECLEKCLEHSKEKIQEIDTELEKMNDDPDCDTEEFLALGMNGCYLNGVARGVQFVINIIKEGKIDKALEAIKELSSEDTSTDEFIIKA